MSARDLRLQVVFAALDRITAPLKSIIGTSKATANALKETTDRIKSLQSQQKEVDYLRKQQQGFRDLSAELRTAKLKLNDTKDAFEDQRVVQQKMVGGVKATRAEFKALQQQMLRTNEPSARLVGQFSMARDKLAKLEGEYSKSTNTLRRLKQAFKEAGPAVDKLKNKKVELAGVLTVTRDRLKAAGISTHNLAKAQVWLKDSTFYANAELADQQKKLAAITSQQERMAIARTKMQKLQGIASRMTGAGVSMTAAGGVGGALLSVPVSAYAKAEDSATQLKVALMRAGAVVPAEFEKINTLAMKLGDRLPGTTSDFQDMMTMLNRQGMSAQTILGGMGEAAAYLGVQLKKAPAEAAEFAAKMQDATKTTERDMMGLMDVIQRTFYLGVDDSNMLQGFSNMSSAMDTLKIKGLEGVKMLAPFLVMSDQTGMDGAAAGNAYRKVFQLSMDKKKIGKANEELGSGNKLDFTNGKGEFAGIENMYRQLDKLKNLSTQKRGSVIKALFGDDAETLRVVSDLMTKGIDGYKEVQAKMAAQATLQERVNVQLGTLKNLWDAATGTFTNGMVAFGESIAPELKAITQWIGDLSQKMGAWARANPQLAGTLMKTAVVVSGLLVGLGGLAIAAAAVLGPFALLKFAVSAVGIKGAGLLPILGDIAGTLAGGSEKIGIFSGLIEKLRDLAPVVGQKLASAWKEADPRILGADQLESLKSFWEKLPDAANSAWEGAGEHLKSFAEDHLKSLGEKFPAAAKRAWASTVLWSNSLGGKLKTSINNAIAGVSTYTSRVWASVKAMSAATAAAAHARMTGAMGYVRTNGIGGTLANAGKGMASGTLGMFKSGAGVIINGIASSLRVVGQTLLFVGRAALMNPIGLLITGIALGALLIFKYWEPIKAWFSGFWKGLTEGLAPLSGLFSGAFSAIGSALEPLRPVWDWLVGMFKTAWDWVSKLFQPFKSTSEQLNTATKSGEGFGKWLASLIVIGAELVVKFTKFGLDIMKGIANGIISGIKWVASAMTMVADKLTGIFTKKTEIHSPSRVFARYGGHITKGLALGIDQGQNEPIMQVSSLAKRLTQIGAGIAISAAAMPAIAFDTRPPVAPHAAGNGMVVHGDTIQITIQAAPGMDENAIARAVAKALDQRDRQKAARLRSSLHDY